MSESTGLIILEEKSVVEAFKTDGVEPFIEKIREEVARHTPDVTSDKGRKAIASLSRKVASSKVALDNIRKELVSEYKNITSKIDAEGKRARDILDELRDRTRKPLDEWESVEETRVSSHKEKIDALDRASTFYGSIEELKQYLLSVETMARSEFEEFQPMANDSIESAINHLNRQITEQIKIQEERTELERLRAAEAARVESERLAKETADAEESNKKLAAEAQERADAVAKAKIEAVQREKEVAEQKARDAEAKALRDAENAKAQADRDKEEAVQRERDRQADEKRREDEETAKREANKKHIGKINREALACMVGLCDEETGKAIITAIALGKIKNVKMVY